MAAFIDLPESAWGLGLFIAGAWTVLSFLFALLVGHAMRVLSQPHPR